MWVQSYKCHTKKPFFTLLLLSTWGKYTVPWLFSTNATFMWRHRRISYTFFSSPRALGTYRILYCLHIFPPYLNYKNSVVLALCYVCLWIHDARITAENISWAKEWIYNNISHVKLKLKKSLSSRSLVSSQAFNHEVRCI